MPTAVVYKNKNNWEKTNRIMTPVVEGLQCVGYEVEVREGMEFPKRDEEKFDLAAVWGDWGGSIEILQKCGSTFRQVLQIDNGFLNRKRYEGHYSVSWGGQRQSQVYLWDSPRFPERFAALNEIIKPWRTQGEEILILAPSYKQAKILHLNIDSWARGVRDTIAKYTKKRILVRIKRYNIDAPLRDVLNSQPIFAAVGYNTKGLVECLLEGVPVFTLGACVTEKMGLKDLSLIEHPYYPDNRLEFFERLAGTQWLLSEIAEGLPFLDKSIAQAS